MNEQLKKWGKIIGIIILVFFAFGLWNIIVGGGNSRQKGNDLQSGYSVNVPMETENSSVMMKNAEPALTGMTENDSVGSSSGYELSEGSSQGTDQDKKVIKNGNLSLKVEKTGEAASRISQIAISMGGEVFSTNFYERVKGSRSGTIVVKVPGKDFENAIAEMKKVATQVINEYTSGQDVTEQYVDLQAQLKNKQAEEQSFVKILDQSGKIDDVLAVTREISRVRGEIERLQGRIKYLQSQIDMATITISLSEDAELVPVGSGWRPGQVFKQSVQDLVKSMQNFADNAIRFVIVGLPSLVLFLIVLGAAWWIGKKIIARFWK
ncbi:MAG: Coiled-coil protein [Parcubacteria group bacterium Athens0714_25]|nr:MAG: Coiled-coil protein [Parcubacteria group bacterium Athens0714_25]